MNHLYYGDNLAFLMATTQRRIGCLSAPAMGVREGLAPPREIPSREP